MSQDPTRRLARLLLTLALAAVAAEAAASSWLETRYGTRDGLPSPYVKAAAEDGAGFVWLATDGGLVRFDGSGFTALLDAPSGRFIKAVASLPDGRVLAAGDSGVSLAESSPRGPRVTRLLPSAERPGPDALHYPKGLFIDSRGRAWVSEVEAIVLLREGRRFERFPFPPECRSTSYVRSFSLAEDTRGRLWAAAWTGALFVFDEAARRFVPVPLPSGAAPAGETYHLASIGPDTLWQATGGGVRELRLSPAAASVSTARRVPGLSSAAWIAPVPGDVLLAVGTGSALGSRAGRPVALSSPAVAQHLLSTRTGDLLLSTDDGFSVLRRRPFEAIPLPGGREPRLSFAAAADGTVHVSDGRTVFRLEPAGSTWHPRRLFELPTGAGGLVGEGGRLAGVGLGRLLPIDGGRVGRPLDVSDRGTHVVGVAGTADGSLWVSQFDAQGLLRFRPDGTRRSYGAAEGLASRITALRVSDGLLFAAGAGRAYLFRYDSATDRFVDDSRPFGFEPPQPFDVRDLARDVRGRIFLASTAGLLQQDGSDVRRVDLGPERTGLPAHALTLTRDGRVWAATSAGLVAWHPDRREYASYDEEAGLPSRNVSFRGLLARGDDLLVATSAGLARAALAELTLNAPAAPVIEDLQVDGEAADLSREPVEVAHGAWLSARAASPGSGERSFQWKLEGMDADWRPPGPRPEAVLPARGSGRKRLLVRTAVRGSNAWGPPAAVLLRLEPAWYATWWAIALFATGFVSFFAVGVLIARRASRRGEERLTRLVEERTRELREANEQLAASNAELERFAYTVSHDLKSPLVTIRGFLGFLEPSAASGDLGRLRGDVGRIRQAAERMSTLLDQLLHLSRVGRTRNPSETMAFAEVVREAARLAEGPLQARGMAVEVDPDLPEVEGDRLRLVEVVQNLLENAAKFAGEARPPRVRVGVRNDTTPPVFYVQDDGIGIAPEHQEKVFGLFEKLDPATEGTGLGLAISRRIVETHGGRLWLESDGPGRGATFCFTLPPPAAGLPNEFERFPTG